MRRCLWPASLTLIDPDGNSIVIDEYVDSFRIGSATNDTKFERGRTRDPPEDLSSGEMLRRTPVRCSHMAT
jgi:hypothetical protein